MLTISFGIASREYVLVEPVDEVLACDSLSSGMKEVAA